jgi:hypothetical protein
MNPNVLSVGNIQSRLNYDQANSRLIKDQDKFTKKHQVQYETIFDQLDSLPEEEPDFVAHTPNVQNPNAITYDVYNNYTKGQTAQQDILNIINTNRAINRGNVGLAQDILGRALEPSDIDLAHGQTTIPPIFSHLF